MLCQSVPRRIVASEVNIEPEPIVNPVVIQNLDPTIYVEPEPEPVVEDHPEVDLIRQVELMDRHHDKLVAVHNGASFRKTFGIRRGRVLKKNGIIESFPVDGGWVVELTDIALKYLGIDYPAAPRPSKGTLPIRYKFERACDSDREELIMLHSGGALGCLAPGRRQKLRLLNIIGPSERLGANWTAKLTDEAIEYLSLDVVEEPVLLEETPSENIEPLEETAKTKTDPIIITKRLKELLEAGHSLCAEYIKQMEEDGYPFADEPVQMDERIENIEHMVMFMAFILHDQTFGIENYGAVRPPKKERPEGLIV